MEHPHHGINHPRKPKGISVVSDCSVASLLGHPLWHTKWLFVLLLLSFPQAVPTTPCDEHQMITKKNMGVLLPVQCAPTLT